MRYLLPLFSLSLSLSFFSLLSPPWPTGTTAEMIMFMVVTEQETDSAAAACEGEYWYGKQEIDGSEVI